MTATKETSLSSEDVRRLMETNAAKLVTIKNLIESPKMPPTKETHGSNEVVLRLMEMNAALLETIKNLTESRSNKSSAARVEFLNFVQGNMKVDEYYDKFLELGLASLVPDPVMSLEMLMARFIEGLKMEIEVNIPYEPFNSLRKLYLEALEIERKVEGIKSVIGEKEFHAGFPGIAGYLPKRDFSECLAQFINFSGGSDQVSCRIEFDGASKGNPGPSGAGAIIRVAGGTEVWRLREGVGIATNNVAEYRGLILGLLTALQKGFKRVFVTGDSLLVCNQIQGIWKPKKKTMADLYEEALELKNHFASFVIEHVPRRLNSDADGLANQAINLQDSQIEREITR